MPRFVVVLLLVAGGALGPLALPSATSLAAPAARPRGTTGYERPVDVAPAAASETFGDHAIPRLIDWDADGDLDLIVAGGDGRILRLLNRGSPTKPDFGPPEPIAVADRPLVAGSSLTTACPVDFDGDGRFDLLVAHSDLQVVWHRNVGDASTPRFDAAVELVAEQGRKFELPRGCGARIDAGDFDGDGDVDLVSGHFSGPLQLHANVGTKAEPRFAEGRAVTLQGEVEGFSYNVHPTLYDVNGDGAVDLAYGMNWGTIGLLIAPEKRTAEAPADFARRVAPSQVDGGSIDLRAIAGDDASPTFGDLDGDGTLDLVSGGRKGRLFFLRGVPFDRQLARLDELLAAHPTDLGAALEADPKLRAELIGLYHALYRRCEGFLTSPASRTELRTWLVDHLARHGRWLRHASHDVKLQPYVPSLAAQTWTALLLMHDGDPDARGHREFVADAIGFQGRLRDILVEFGTLIVENGRATPNQLETLHSYLTLIPAPLLGDRRIGRVTEVITIGEYLGPRLELLNAGGVNIFANESGKPGSSENPFPDDFRPVENDYFGVVLAHELNHRVDATRFVVEPKYDRKYWDHMAKVCEPDVKFVAPPRRGVDWESTKRHFRERQWWNGRPDDWNKAWADYWLTGAGAGKRRNVCRNHVTYTPPRYGVPFFLETRQESIASLANQYFTDSAAMLQFALQRHRDGSSGCLDEWLLMADVYSLDGPTTLLYRHSNGSVKLQRETAPVTRDDQGRIVGVVVDGVRHQFQLDDRGLVVQATQTKVGRVGPPPASMKLDPFYKKYVDADGFPIVSSDQVADHALLEAAFLVRILLGKRPDLRDAMVRGGSRLVVIGRREFTTDIPEHRHFQPKDFWDRRARGTGGSITDPICTCGEENLLGYPGDPYAAECILIHEFAHHIHLRGMNVVDPEFDGRVKAAYDAALRDGLWKDKYAATNHHEYLAEGVQSWFDNNRPPDHDHNHVRTRKDLQDYDPRLAKLCAEIFLDTQLSYTKPAERLRDHLADYDPARAPKFVWPEHLEKLGQKIREDALAKRRANAAPPPAKPAPEKPDAVKPDAAKPDAVERPAPPLETRMLEGWTVEIHERLLKERPEETRRALELCGAQLREIVRIVPAPAVAELRKVRLRFSPEYDGVPPRAEYHPDAGWLKNNGRDVAMAKCVEFTNVRIFEAEVGRMPLFVLHELAHAYHDRFLGFDHAGIKAAFQQAVAGKRYEAVERWRGPGKPAVVERSYALVNEKEYFAELTEAYFGRNDFFPFVREELRRHDPGAIPVLEEVWRVKQDEPTKR